METHKVTKDKRYLITANTETTVKDVESGITMKVIPANSQRIVIAISNNFTTEGECVVHPFVDATCTHLEINPSSVGGTSGEPEGDYLTFDENNVVTGGRLQYVSSLRYLQSENSKIKVWNIPMPNLKNADHMFYKSGIEEFSSPLDSLQIADFMFRECPNLRAFSTTSLANVTGAHSIFYGVTKINIGTWEYDMPKLVNCEWGFPGNALKLTCWRGKLDKLSNAYNMFNSQQKLSSFEADLPALTRADGFMNGTILDKPSALRVLTTIPAYTSGTHNLTIGFHIDHQADEEVLAAIEAAESKGWKLTVQWNGTATANAASTYGLRTPPIYARVVEDEHGKHLNWGHYVTDQTGYEEFRSVEEAQAHFDIEEQ